MSELHFLPSKKSGRTKQPIHVTAAVIGVEPHVVRQWLSKGLFGEAVKGERQGREHRLDMGEATFLRLLAEVLTINNSSVKGAWSSVLGLAQAAVPLAKAEPPFPLDLFAVETWAGLGNEREIERFICQGRPELADCLAEAAAKGRPHVHVLAISRLFAEMATGWDIAALGAEAAFSEFQAGYLPRLPESEHADALAMFAQLERRITGKRRSEPEATASWPTYQSAANVA